MQLSASFVFNAGRVTVITRSFLSGDFIAKVTPMGAGASLVLMSTIVEEASEPRVHFVTGRERVLCLSQRLMEFSELCGQSGSMHDLVYFLSKPGALPRIPHLLLLGADELDPSAPKLADLVGAVLIFEQQIGGFGLGAFATNDRSGRSTLLARPEDRMRVAAMASGALMDRGAHLVLMSFRAQDSNEPVSPAQPFLAEGGRYGAHWARRERTIPGYLPLSTTYDATLAGVGTRTRRNLRYYRRRAEAELGCVFVPQVEVTREELLSFNKQCMFAVSRQVAGWRYDSLKELSGPVFMGMKDKDGRWLSMLAGRRYLDRTDILWQMNRDGLAEYSLGTAMRAYFIEHEIAHGSRRLYTEGGTPHSMRFSFVPEDLTDLIIKRDTLAAKAMQIVARRYIRPDNELSHMLDAPELKWAPC
jgi:hypothetical protein